MEQTDRCQHDCHNSLGSYTCSCNIGFQIDLDGRACNGELNTDNKPIITMFIIDYSILSDINECSDGTHNCEQVCDNTYGSYNCRCLDGYELQNDSYSCAGTEANVIAFTQYKQSQTR